MNVYVKWGLRSVLVVVSLVVILVLYVAFFVDPNDYKAEISALVKQETGRDFKIEGNIGLSLFPWTGLEVNKVTLAETKEYAGPYFAQIERLDIKASFWALLSGKLEAKSVIIRGLKVNLEVNKKGKFNLDELIAASDSSSVTPDNASPTTGDTGFVIDKIEITHSEINYVDNVKGKTSYSIKNFNLSTEGLGQAGAKNLSMTFDFKPASKLKSVKIKFKTKIEYTSKLGRLVLHQFSAQLDKLKLSGQLKVEGLDSKPSFEGSVSSNEFSPRFLIKKFGGTLPDFNDNSVISKAQVKTNFEYKGVSLKLTKINSYVDNSTISGKIILNLSQDYPPFHISLKVNELDLDRYLLKVDDKAQARQRKSRSRSKSRLSAHNSIIPELMIRELRGNGVIRIKRFKTSGVTMTNVKLGITAGKGRLRFYPLRANLYQGRYGGDIRIQVYKKRAPRIRTKERLKNVQAGPISASFIPKSVKEKIGLKQITGILNLNSSLRTSGRDARQFQRNLNGQLDFSFRDGRLDGVSPFYRACQLYNLTRGRATPEYSEEFEKFGNFEGSIRFVRGKGRIRKLKIEGHSYRASARGYIDLRREYYDLKFKLVIMNNCDLSGGDGRRRSQQELQLRCKGSFNSDKNPCKLDVKKILKKQLLRQIFKSKNRGSEGGERSDKDRLKEELFRGLFGG